MISTSSTPLAQQMAMRLSFSRLGSPVGPKRNVFNSRFSSPSAVVSSSVEIDGTGEVVISCCMRWKEAACSGVAERGLFMVRNSLLGCQRKACPHAQLTPLLIVQNCYNSLGEANEVWI
jgi:hypothetical protein